MDEFWTRTTRVGNCLEWTGARNSDGYGSVTWDGRTQGAHRVAFLLTHGAIPDGLWVLHHCDNPPCCEPAHIYAGTSQDNVDDRQRRGRAASHKGSLNGRAKISEEVVDEIRRRYAAGETSDQLAASFGISRGYAWQIAAGKFWDHIPNPHYVKKPLGHRYELDVITPEQMTVVCPICGTRSAPSLAGWHPKIYCSRACKDRARRLRRIDQTVKGESK